ncbi:MAG: hypothetical protein JWP89_1549 [Schlesneria sp.]|nr:hypothetical protein [Schlesneria sp.]
MIFFAPRRKWQLPRSENGMADQWYYRMFGQDFGPVSFDELKQLAELGSISSDDEVRQSSAAAWSAAGSVTALGQSTSSGPKSILSAIAEAPVQAAPSGANDWYYMFHGQEMGPIGFGEIVAFAEQGQLEASDEVRLGAAGKWRRVGSIGRLVAVLPYHEPVVPEPMPFKQKLEAPPAPAAVPPALVRAAMVPAASKPVLNIPDEGLIQAQATFTATDQAARTLVSWALAPNVDPAWWGWIGGVERGPIGFVQIYEWAISGQLQASDYVKNGMFGQYVHAASVPGLYNAVSLVVPARQMLEVAKATAAANAARVAKSNPVVTTVTAPAASVPATPSRSAANLQTVAPTPLPVKKSSADIPVSAERVVPREPADPIRPVEVRASEPQPAPVSPRPASSGGFAAPQASYTRPATPSRPSMAARRDSGPGAFEAIKDPKVLGGVGAVVALVALTFGWQYLPFSSGKDVEIYRQAQALVNDVRAARAANSTDFSSFKTRAEQLKTKYVADLKNEASNAKPAKQSLLFALRDEIPRMVSGNLAVESPSEKSAVALLQEAAKRLGVK